MLEAGPVAAIALMAAITFATLVAGALIVSVARPSARLDRLLDAMSTSAIAAVVVSFLAGNGVREAAAVVVAGLAVLALRNAAAAMIAGMAFAAAWVAIAP